MSDELITRRSRLFAKISMYNKKGKDTSELVRELEDVKMQIKITKDNLKTTTKDTPKATTKTTKDNLKTASKVTTKATTKTTKDTPKATTKTTKDTPKITEDTIKYTTKQLSICKKEMDEIIENNDWKAGYFFMSSTTCKIKDIETKIAKNCVELHYTIQYITKNHRIEKHVTRRFNPDNYEKILPKYINDVEIWFMLNSGDMDDKNIVFGERFNKTQFIKQGYPERGWKMYR